MGQRLPPLHSTVEPISGVLSYYKWDGKEVVAVFKDGGDVFICPARFLGDRAQEDASVIRDAAAAHQIKRRSRYDNGV